MDYQTIQPIDHYTALDSFCDNIGALNPELPRSKWNVSFKDVATHTLVRSLAFKWIRILYQCWKTHTPYNESVYLNALRKKGSPLLKNFALDVKTA
jgi:hypothetical protein